MTVNRDHTGKRKNSFLARFNPFEHCRQGTRTPGIFFNKTLYITLCLCALVANLKVLAPGKVNSRFAGIPRFPVFRLKKY